MSEIVLRTFGVYLLLHVAARVPVGWAAARDGQPLTRKQGLN